MADKIIRAMKRFMMMFAMAQMIIWSCVKPEIDAPVIDNVNPEDVVFTAVTEATKADPAAGGAVTWTMNDEIGVYDGTNYVKATVLSVDGDKITFSASVNAAAANYIAVSPYEAALADGAFSIADGKVKIATAATQTAGKQVISIASIASASEQFTFKNVGNLLRFKVNKAAVKKAKIAGANGEKIAGTLSVDPATGAATGELSATEVVVDVTPGVDNFIALAPGVSLPNGFVITLLGSEADYEGEVASAGALTLERNKMVNLGLIDGWIDNYKLWQAGKPITIAGVEYTKASTGLDGKVLTATTEAFDVYNDLYGKTGAFFLEATEGSYFTPNSHINVGSSSTTSGMMLISRYDNSPALIKPSKHFTLMGGNFYCKNVHFDHVNSTSTYLFATYQTLYGNAHLDGCKFVQHAGDCLFYLNGTQPGAKSIKIVNSKIESTSNARVLIVNSSSTFAQWDNINEIIFDNNVIYNKNVDGMVTVIGDNAKVPSSGTRPNTIVELTNNTFYNMRGTNTYLVTYSLSSLKVTGNLFYSKSTAASYSHIARSVDTYEYPYVVENNIANYPRMYYFNPYQDGAYKALGLYVGKTDANFFSTADTDKGVFIPTEAYASYGAKQ